MPPASKQSSFRRADLWSALACLLFLLAKAVAIVPAAPSLPSTQGVVALRWQDQERARDTEATAESRRVYLAASRMRVPADAGGSQDMVPPKPPALVVPIQNGGLLPAARSSVPPPSTALGFSARAPPAAG
ncbi:MAG TPA: hypothetical protein VNS34_28340 [Rhizobiaceae bacterium]|nr:hypothetical protein [Rhizobiaceae bacterium]